MLLKRRNFLKSGLAGTAGIILSSPVSAFPRLSVLQDTNTVTLSFCGTSCTRDEGEVSRSDSNKDIYLPSTGYIPVRLMKELGGLGCSGQQILATVLEVNQYNRSDSLGVNPPLYW
ncbi:TPA: twin-arginine translocation signal domain-containing protein [Photobacterium damselae]